MSELLLLLAEWLLALAGLVLRPSLVWVAGAPAIATGRRYVGWCICVSECVCVR